MAKTVGNTTGQANDYTVATGAGAVDADTQRLTLASNDPAVALLTTIDADTGSLPGIATSVDGIETLIGTTNSALATIDGRVDGIEALLTTIDGRVDGLETLITATNALLTVGASSLTKAEDAVAASADAGVMVLAVRRDSASGSAADGDYIALSTDSSGNLRVTTAAGAGAGPTYGSTTLLESTGLNSLATSTTVGYATAEVDVSAAAARDVQVLVEAQMTTSGSPTGFVEVYAIASLDGTEYSGDTSYSGSAGAYTLGAAGSVNLTLIGVIKPHANTATYRGLFSLATAFGGFVPPFWAIVVLNNSAIALHTSGSTVNYRIIT